VIPAIVQVWELLFMARLSSSPGMGGSLHNNILYLESSFTFEVMWSGAYLKIFAL